MTRWPRFTRPDASMVVIQAMGRGIAGCRGNTDVIEADPARFTFDRRLGGVPGVDGR